MNYLEEFFGQFAFRVIGWWWDRINNPKIQRFCANRIIPPNETTKYINNTKIFIEINREFSTMNSQNIVPLTPGRGFIAPACKRFQLIDNSRENLKNFFKIDSEIKIFENVEDLKNKIYHYLKNDKERNEIEENSYIRSKEHTPQKRIQEIIRICEQ